MRWSPGPELSLAVRWSPVCVDRRALVTVIGGARRLPAAGLTAHQATGKDGSGEFVTWSLRDSRGARAIQRVFTEA